MSDPIPDPAKGALQRPLARGTGLAQHQDNAGYGALELPDARHGSQGNMGLSARLQFNSADDGASRVVSESSAAPTELQAYGATVDRVA